MSRVYRGDGKCISVDSNDGKFRFVATRRAVSTIVRGMTKYIGSHWTVETYRNENGRYVGAKFSNMKYEFKKKQEVIDHLSTFQCFSEAVAELKTK